AQIRVSGTFSSNAELDKKYVFTSFNFAQKLFELNDACTGVEVYLNENANPIQVKSELIKLFPNLKIQTREDKNAIVYKTNASEKWATYLILVFILIIASFNILASLTLLIIEKKKDIFILVSMGATRKTIRNIFILEGVFINLIGACVGTILGLLITVIQQKVGLVRMEGAIVEYYPMNIEPLSVVGIFFTAFLVGSAFCLFVVPSLLNRFTQASKDF
ncbi:MAG: ABC transporter permease, partial [Bacteroidota bacterium]